MRDAYAASGRTMAENAALAPLEALREVQRSVAIVTVVQWDLMVLETLHSCSTADSAEADDTFE